MEVQTARRTAAAAQARLPAPGHRPHLATSRGWGTWAVAAALAVQAVVAVMVM